MAVVFLCFDVSEGRKKKKKLKKKAKRRSKVPKQEVALTELELCEGCYTYQEEYFKAVLVERKRVISEMSKTGKQLSVDGDQVAKKLCGGPEYVSILSLYHQTD